MLFRSRHLIRFALLCGVAASMAGCSSLRAAAGTDKESPDEFAVVTKAPLVIPPDFNLRPPAAGAAPTNQVEPTQAAQAALFNADPATVAASLPATMSTGERYLLAYAGVQNADPAIRQEIASDANATRSGDDSFTNNILFGSTASTGAVPVDADAEARRLDAARGGGTTATPPPGVPAARPPGPPAAPPQDSDKGGWLDDIFGGIF